MHVKPTLLQKNYPKNKGFTMKPLITKFFQNSPIQNWKIHYENISTFQVGCLQMNTT